MEESDKFWIVLGIGFLLMLAMFQFAAALELIAQALAFVGIGIFFVTAAIG